MKKKIIEILLLFCFSPYTFAQQPKVFRDTLFFIQTVEYMHKCDSTRQSLEPKRCFVWLNRDSLVNYRIDCTSYNSFIKSLYSKTANAKIFRILDWLEGDSTCRKYYTKQSILELENNLRDSFEEMIEYDHCFYIESNINCTPVIFYSGYYKGKQLLVDVCVYLRISKVVADYYVVSPEVGHEAMLEYDYSLLESKNYLIKEIVQVLSIDEKEKIMLLNTISPSCLDHLPYISE